MTVLSTGAGAWVDTTLPAPPGLRASTFTRGEDEFLVLSYPAVRRTMPRSLTATERDVARAVVGGLSNRQIAAARGVALRTIANQVAAVLRKSGVRSRIELVRKLVT